MKIKKRTEPDLYVVNRPFTATEKAELSTIIANYKRNHKLKYPETHPGSPRKKAKKYQSVESELTFAAEPEPGLFVVNSHPTEQGMKAMAVIVERLKQKERLKARRSLARKKLKVKPAKAS